MKNRIVFTLAICLAMLSQASFAQQKLTGKMLKRYNEAYEYASESNNRKAIELFKSIYEKNPNDINVAYNLGVCYMNMSGNPDTALFYFYRTLELDDDVEWTSNKSELMMSVARVKQLKYDYDGALAAYDDIEKNDKTGEWDAAIAREREICTTAQYMMSNQVNIFVKKLDANVNSASNDYRPVVSLDQKTMIFTSRRKYHGDKELTFEDGEFEEKTYITRRDVDGNWQKAQVLTGLFDRKGQETVTCMRDSELYVVRDGDIYVSRLGLDGNWQKAQSVGSPINSKSEERYVYVTPSGNEMFFSSNRNGGFGGFDLYHSYRLPNGKWGVPRNMGSEVNTEYDEDSPVLHPTKNILYFSSNGHNTMGGFDVFYSIGNDADSTYSSVKNIGYPINTPDDDLYFVPTEEQDKAYFASICWGSSSQEFTGYDIYEVEYDEPEITTLVVLNGVVKSENVADVRITLSDGNGEMIGRYVPNARTGKYVIIVEEGNSYDLTIECGEESKTVKVNPGVGDSYYKSGRTLAIETMDFMPQIVEIEPQDPLTPYVASAQVDETSQSDEEWDYYTVQVFSLKNPLDKRRVKSLDTNLINEYVYRNGWYVYSYGKFDSHQKANEMKAFVREHSPYRDAFVRYAKQYKKYVVGPDGQKQ